MELLEHWPFDFGRNHPVADVICLDNFVPRRLNGAALLCFVYSLKNRYLKHYGLQTVFAKYPGEFPCAEHSSE